MDALAPVQSTGLVYFFIIFAADLGGRAVRKWVAQRERPAALVVRNAALPKKKGKFKKWREKLNLRKESNQLKLKETL